MRAVSHRRPPRRSLGQEILGTSKAEPPCRLAEPCWSVADVGEAQLPEEGAGERRAFGGRDDVRAGRGRAARVVTGRAAADRNSAHRGTAKGEGADRETAERAQETD